MRKRKEKVKSELYQKIAVNVGNPGVIITGNAFRSFSTDYAREVISSLVLDEDKEAIRDILLGLCAIVKVINSQNR